MAEAAVGFVLRKLADALQKKAQELKDVHGQIERMQDELGFIKACLRDAHFKSKGNAEVKEWVNQVRDISYRIEDVIDTFLVEIGENRPNSSSWLKKNYKKLGLVDKLEQLTEKLNVIDHRRTILGIRDLGASAGAGAGSEENGHQTFRRTKPSDNVDDSEVVGLEDYRCQIINQLLDRKNSRRTVLSIAGIGGIGKTTLAQKVYKSAELGRQFDCRTWLYISQKFNLNDLLREMLYSIEPRMKQQEPAVTDDQLPVKLESSLRHKRYLIILDDVWKIDHWEELKKALPDHNNASRVIITTRSLEIAGAANRNTEPYKLRCLNADESLALLFWKAFEEHIQPKNYPRDLLNVATKLTKKCGGLPLALVALGSILSRREPNNTIWSNLEQTMDWHNEDGKKCSQVLAMSYEDLPYHLKPCFLYFASFPEDYTISGKHVTKMWVAEGFIPKDGAGTMEDRAEAYLEELVQRCLIQVTKKSWNGNCKYCRMHDLLRDLAISEAKEENFFTIFSNGEDVNQLATRKPRRAALQFCTLTKDGIYSESTRSLLCFGFENNSTNDCRFGLLKYSGFRLLRVLTIQNVDTRNIACRKLLKDLMHLKYFGFRYCIIGENTFNLDSSTIYNLETIDLKGSKFRGPTKQKTRDRPIVIPTLRHVYGNMDLEQICRLKWDSIANLQTLKGVGQRELPELGCGIKNLHTLVIHYQSYGEHSGGCSDNDIQTLKDVMRRTEQLISLKIITSILHSLPFGGTTGLPCHENIQSLHLRGELIRCVPIVEMLPTNLSKLILQSSKLEKDPMPILERLQSLRILQLGPYSYEGTELICSTGGFPKLEKLMLKGLPKLCHWDIKERAMPILSLLKINTCREFHALPELQKVQTLKQLLVKGPSCQLQQRMQGEDLGSWGFLMDIPIIRLVCKSLIRPKDLYKIKHIPYVRITRYDGQ